jgi:hypothetical protein
MIARSFVTLAALAAAVLLPARGSAYPGGTPSYQTDAAPFCAGCHASREASALEGAGERATKELVANKHLAVIRAADPRSGYAALSDAQRETLIGHIEALDRASTVTLDAPQRVAAGATFEVRVAVTGGAGPVVGVALVDRAHRWYARPAASAGWQVAAPPEIRVAGEVEDEWLEKRPAALGRNLSFVNVPGVRSDAAAGEFASAEVTFTLRAPSAPGALPLAAVFLYGTEKGSPLGTTTDALGRKRTLGGLGGGSGRVLFTPVRTIRVE